MISRQISKIELVRCVAEGRPFDITKLVKVTTLNGEWGFFNSPDIQPVDTKEAKDYFDEKLVKGNYPIWVDDIVLFAQKDAIIRDLKLFKAVVNGRQIDLKLTVEQEKKHQKERELEKE